MFSNCVFAVFELSAQNWIALTASLGAASVAALGGYFLVRRRHAVVPSAAGGSSPLPEQLDSQLLRQEERRQSPRPWGPPVEVKIKNGLLSGTPWRGWVVNRSLGGVCLSLPEAIAIGTPLSIHATIAPESLPWTQIQVKHCEFKVNRWLVGGEFTETIPIEALRLFGYR